MTTLVTAGHVHFEPLDEECGTWSDLPAALTADPLPPGEAKGPSAYDAESGLWSDVPAVEWYEKSIEAATVGGVSREVLDAMITQARLHYGYMTVTGRLHCGYMAMITQARLTEDGDARHAMRFTRDIYMRHTRHARHARHAWHTYIRCLYANVRCMHAASGARTRHR